jgi:hypothetical protein
MAGLSSKEPECICLQCGGPIADGLARYGSVLCHECRDDRVANAILLVQRSPGEPPLRKGFGQQRPPGS